MINMTSNIFFVLFSLLFVIGTVQIAYAGGSGSEESDVLFLEQNYYKVKLETTPSILEGNESQIIFDITTINDDTQQIVSNVEYKIDVFDSKDNLAVSFDVYSPDEKLKTIIFPSQNLDFSGEKTENGLWIGSNSSPLTIEAPLFLEGGLVKVNITILSIDSKSITDEATFEILFTMGEFIPFNVEIDDKNVDLTFATYFDKIDEFNFDNRNKKLTAQMYFNWDKDFIESIPFVHAEYYIPKTVDIFDDHKILLTVNDQTYFGTIDRSGDEEIVIHFLLSSSKLLKMIDQIPAEQQDKMIFGIESGKEREDEKEDASLEDGEKAIILSTEEDWKFHLYLEPKGKINPDEPVILNIEFHDPVTNSIIQQITYDLDVFLNGVLVLSEQGLETPSGRDSQRIVFTDLGSVIVRISNVNNFDTSGQFSFQVSKPKAEPHNGDFLVDIAKGSYLPGCEDDDSCYIPSSLNVPVNQIVFWDNKDSSAHTVTSGSPDAGSSGTFDSGVIASGEQYSYNFAKQGIFDYYCTLHPWMLGTIIVGDAKPAVPDWIRNNTEWWSQEQIDDNTFIQGIQFLIKEDILKIPPTTQGDGGSNEIPAWIKNNAEWWAEGAIDDDSFIQGIQYLIKEGIMRIQN